MGSEDDGAGDGDRGCRCGVGGGVEENGPHVEVPPVVVVIFVAAEDDRPGEHD